MNAKIVVVIISSLHHNGPQLLEPETNYLVHMFRCISVTTWIYIYIYVYIFFFFPFGQFLLQEPGNHWPIQPIKIQISTASGFFQGLQCPAVPAAVAAMMECSTKSQTRSPVAAQWPGMSYETKWPRGGQGLEWPSGWVARIHWFTLHFHETWWKVHENSQISDDVPRVIPVAMFEDQDVKVTLVGGLGQSSEIVIVSCNLT